MPPQNAKPIYQHLPDAPGVYLMRGTHGQILYIGKAANLKRRVSSYFERPHEYRIQQLVQEIAAIDYRKTDTALEALILEAELIKKRQPPYNVREKDDKSFLCVEITNEPFPRILLARGHDGKNPKHTYFGPFTSAGSLRAALKLLRRIFPWSTHPRDRGHETGDMRQGRNRSMSHVTDNHVTRRPCFDYEIGLCPGTCAGLISRADYLKNIRAIKLIFQGKKKELVRGLKRDMRAASKQLAFEQAEKLKRQIFALQHIQDIALISESDMGHKIWDMRQETRDKELRIEGYDISNISGTSAVGSMVVFRGNQPDKNEYRKFRIKTIHQSDDVGMLKEVLRRRFSRAREGRRGWTLPYLLLIDGGKPQVNAARAVLAEFGLKIPVVGIAKGPTRKKSEFIGAIPHRISPQTLIRVRDEAHRFAVRYHERLRSRAFMCWTSTGG